MAVACPRDILTGSCGAVYCGEAHTADFEVARVTNWTVESTAESKTWADSSLCTVDGLNFVQRLPGNKSATGTVDFIYVVDNDAAPFPQDVIIVEGLCCYLILTLDKNTLLSWVIPVALITRFSLTVNVRDAEPVGGSFSFESSGVYYSPFDINNPLPAP